MPVDPSQLAARLQNLQQQGYSSLPFQVQGSLADSGVPNEQINQTAQQFSAADQATNGPASYWFDDPVLQKKDSPALQIKRYVSAAFGAWPIQQADLAKIQTSMQKAGYGKGLKANGVWNGAWYGEYSQANQDRLAKSRSGDTGSLFSKATGGVLKEFNRFLPEGTISTIAGIAKAVPGSLRTTLEDIGYGVGATAGYVADVPQMAASLGQANPNYENQFGGAVGSGIANVTGDTANNTSTKFLTNMGINPQTGHTEDPGRLVARGGGDIANILLASSLIGHAAPLARAAGDAFIGPEGASQAEINAAREAAVPQTAEEAGQGNGLVSRAPLHRPGIVAQWIGKGFNTIQTVDPVTGETVNTAVSTGLRPALNRFAGGAATGAAVGGIGAGLTGQNPVEGAALGAAVGGIGGLAAGTQAIRNNSILGRIAPVIDDLVNPSVDAEGNIIQGRYYRFRNGSWNPYMIDNPFGTAVRTTGGVLQKGSAYIGAAGVGSDIAHAIDPNSTWGKISQDKTGQMVNGKFVEFQKNIPYLPFQATVNDLVFALHGNPEGDATASKIFGKSASSVVAPTYHAFSDLNGVAISRANDNMSLDEIIAKHFPETGQKGLMDFYTPAIETITAHDQATKIIDGLPDATRPAMNSDERTAMILDQEGRIKANRQKLYDDTAAAMKESGGSLHYAQQLAKKFILAEQAPGEFANDAEGLVKARDIMVNEAHPYLVANEDAVNQVNAADMHADAHQIDMGQRIDEMKKLTLATEDPTLQAHFRNVRETMQTALGDEQHLQKALGDAMKTGNQGLIDKLTADHEAAVTNTQNLLAEKVSNVPGEVTPAQQAVLDHSTTDFLAHKEMWNKSLADHNRAHLLVNPDLADKAANLGLAGIDTMTYEAGSHILDSLEKNIAAARKTEQGLIDSEQSGQAWNVEARGVTREDVMHDVQTQKQAIADALVKYLSEEMGQNYKDPLQFGRAVTGETVDARLDGLLAYAKKQTGNLAREVQLTDDSPDALWAAFNKIHELGYKPVMGHDIGLDYQPFTMMDATSGQLDATRRAAGIMGVEWEPTAQADINTTYQNALYKRLATAIHDGKFENYPGMTPKTWVQVMRAAADEETPGFISRTISNLGQRLGAYGNATEAPWKSFVGGVAKQLVPDKEGEFAARVAELQRVNPALTPMQAENAAIGDMTRSMVTRHGLRDMSQGKFIKWIMDPANFQRLVPDIAMHEESVGIEAHGFAKTLDEAGQMYQQVKNAYNDVPMSQVGLEHFENIVRSSMGFLGDGQLNIGGHEFSKPATRVIGAATLGAIGGVALGNKGSPGDYLTNALQGGAIGAAAGTGLEALNAKGIVNADRMGWAMSNLPNNLIRARNEWRFNLSPVFSLRRQVKTSIKMSLEANVTPTMRPAAALIASGEGYDAAMARVNRLFPPMKDLPGWDAAADSAVRMVEDNDMFGIYNMKQNMAYMAQGMAEQGKSDQEIRNAVDKVFNYTSGSRFNNTQVVGRSALERSANFMFFPFSFDKRLYSAMAGYILDRPAQQVLLTGALATYNEFQKTIDANNPLSLKWLQNHAPLLDTMQKMNPLSHGVSIGEAGGINRPLMNAFLPQIWHPTANNNQVLQQFIPAIKDLKDVTTQLAQQGQMFGAASQQMFDLLPWEQNYTRFGNPGPSTLSKYAQQSSAFNMQAQWYDKYAKILDYNRGRPLVDQIKFPTTNDYGQFGGLGITKQNIKDIISKRYPYYDPTKAVTIAANNQVAIRAYEEKNRGTTNGQYAAGLITAMNKIGPQIANLNTPAQAAHDTIQQIRNAAIWLASRDPEFYKIYQKNYQKMFGPLEEFSNG